MFDAPGEAIDIGASIRFSATKANVSDMEATNLRELAASRTTVENLERKVAELEAAPAAQAVEPVRHDQINHLLDELVRLAGRRDVLHAEHMGKVMPDETLAVYYRIRDERIPALKAQIAALAATPAIQAAPAAVAVPEQRVAPGQGDEAFWTWWDPYKLPEYWFVEIHKIARDAWNAALAATPPAPEPIQAEMLAALQAVAMDAVSTGSGESAISDAARAKVNEVLAKAGVQWADQGAAANTTQVHPAWSGWACMYPGKLPRLYGAHEIASVNLDAANGDQLIHLSTSPAPQAQDVQRDAAIEELCQLGYKFDGGKMIPPDFAGELWAVVKAAPCACKYGTCETKNDRACRMTQEIAASAAQGE